MENKIVTAIFKDSTHTKVSDVWQYDYGQILRIQGLNLPTAVEVDFAVAGSSESIARIGTTKDGVTDVVIPDSLIETGNNLVAYIYLRDSASGNTEYQIDILVTKRAKPEAYDTPEDKELFGQAIEAVNTAADRAEKAGQTAQEAAQKAGLNAEQTAQDRVEVAKMVETVTDISEQVKKVEELSNKAQESATQAGTSATAAEKAKAQAETAAGKTAEDRTAVNQAKIDVDEVQKAVRADRAAVEEAKQSVEQLSNAIPESTQAGVQAVNQAKQTAVDEIARTGISHKTAVEGAGTQAVENVENVKASATEAVETAKTEAVQSIQTEGNTQTGNVTTEGTKQVKAVQDKGNEVLQSIPEDFQMQMESKLDKQQGVENKGKALVIGEDGNVAPGEVQSGGGDGIAIINTMSGESPLVIPDSAERANKRLELGGKTEQVQTTGAQLFDIAKCPLEHNGISFKIPKSSGDVVLMDGYVFEENTQYTISAQKTTSKNENSAVFKFEYVDGSRNEIKVKDIAGKSLTSMSGKTVKRFLVVNPFGAVDEVFNFQFEKGVTATPYEPYTGGKPSPSTEYPQEIKSVGQWNEEKQKYEVDVKVTGKNLLNEEHFFDMKNWENNQYNMRLQPNTQYVFSRRDNVGYGSNIFLSIKNTKDDRFSQIINSNSQSDSKQSVKFKTKETGLVWFLVQNNSGINLKDMLGYAQIEVGEISTEHELYKEQTLTLTSDRQITKWDRLVEQGGQIGWLYKHKIIEDFSALVKDTEPIYGNDEGKYFSVSLQNASLNYDRSKIYSEAGVYGKDNKIHYIPQPMTTNAIIHVSDTDTIMTAKEHMHYKVIYETTESQFTHLPQSEQNAIRALKTYYPTTVITVDGGEVDPDIKVTYTADTKNYIDNKVSAKVASIIRQYRLNTANLLSLMPMETQAAMIENDTNNILENVEEMKHE